MWLTTRASQACLHAQAITTNTTSGSVPASLLKLQQTSKAPSKNRFSSPMPGMVPVKSFLLIKKSTLPLRAQRPASGNDPVHHNDF
eukprot:845264-Amphidinium_carterae.1